MRMHGNKKVKRILLGLAATFTAVAVVSGTVFLNSDNAMAKSSLPGVEAIVNNNGTQNPFIIVEVVPTYGKGSMGYLVAGQEPVDSEDKAIADMPVYGERISKLSTETSHYKYSELKDAAFTTDDPWAYDENTMGSRNMTIWGTYTEVTPGDGDYVRHAEGTELKDYNDTNVLADYPTFVWDEYEINGSAENYERISETFTLFCRCYDFTEDSSGTYLINKLVKISGEEVAPVSISGSTTDFNWQYFKPTKIESEMPEVGRVVYSQANTDDPNPTLEYYGKIELRNIDGEDVSMLICAADGTELSLEDIQNESAVSYFTIVPERQDGSGNYYKIDDVIAGSEFAMGDVTYEEMLKYGGVYDVTTVPVGWEYLYGNKQSSGFDYDPGNGDYIFDQDFKAEQVDDFYYDGGFYNKEWFKQFVLDIDNDAEKLNAVVIDVVTVTPEDLTEELLAETNLLYFAGKCDGVYYESDLDNKVAATIVRQVKNDNFPVIIERSTLVDGSFGALLSDDGSGNSVNGVKTPKINAMAACLMHQGSIPTVSNPDSNDWGIGDWNSIFNNLHGAYVNDVGDKEYSYVNGTVYVNDDLMDDANSICSPTSSEISTCKVVAADFDTKFGNRKTDGGFKPVINEIESENIYLEAAKKDKLAVEATKAKAIRHILNYGDRRNTTKSQLTILDIEPYENDQYINFKTDGTIDTTELANNVTLFNGSLASFTLSNSYTDFFTPRWLIDNVTTQFEGNIQSRTELADGTAKYLDKDNNEIMSVRQMGTKEFIGKTEDLNETYDLIYVGADTLLMNSRMRYTRNSNRYSYTAADMKNLSGGNYPEKSPFTVFNDDKMGDMIYSHVGDVMNKTQLDSFNGSNNYRLSGNDITEQKYNELIRYLDAGYAIILSDYFFYDETNGAWWSPNTYCRMTVNTKRVDSSSYMYKFLTECMSKNGDGTYKYYGKNVFRKFELETSNVNYAYNLAEFINHLNIAKMQVECEAKPRDYNSEGYLVDEDKDGVYWLEYVVTLKNDAAVGASDNRYTAKLYIDDDADGKYETEEELTGLEISRTGDGSSIAYNDLSVGSTYRILRQVPEGYVGCISWKLVFSQNDSSNVSRSISGFSAVPASSKPVIKVLQISSTDSNKDNTWDNTHMEHLDLEGKQDEKRGVSADATIERLFTGVNDFSIEVTRVCAKDYINDNVGNYADYLSNFHMVVLGFTDSYAYSDETWGISNAVNCRNSILAIRDYALSGRSVLFTHDLTYYSYNGGKVGSFVNPYLRDVQGMDRFGVFADKLPDSTGVTPYNTKYDTILKLKGADLNDGTKMGYSDSIVVRYPIYSNFYGITNREGSRTYNTTYTIDNNEKDTSSTNPEYIAMINEGQITRYPYLITTSDNPYFAATNTHSQYFQLNLDTVDSYWLSKEERESKKEIEGDDITVWYTIGNRSVDNSEDSSKSSVTNTNKNYYRAIQKDVRNDYYLYSRGNVFYTGAGHSFVDNALERKLFVNTLVAAYNAGKHAPSVEYKENKYSQASGMKNNTITNMYLPYDGTINQFLDEDDMITINFRAKNINIRNNSKPLYAKFYISVPNGTAGSLTIGKKSYKEVAVTFVARDGVDIGDGDVATDAGCRLLGNYTTYSVKISRDALGLDSSAVHDINKGNFDFYIRLGLDALDPASTFSILPAEESMTPLNIFCTELLDLE